MSFGVSRRTGRATAVADGQRRPSSGAHAPPSPIGRRNAGSNFADMKPAPNFSNPFNTPTVFRTVLPGLVQPCATLLPSRCTEGS